jgi:hypothetical protein
VILKVDSIDESYGDTIRAQIRCYELDCSALGRATIEETTIRLAPGWTLETEDGNHYGYQCPGCKLKKARGE